MPARPPRASTAPASSSSPVAPSRVCTAQLATKAVWTDRQTVRIAYQTLVCSSQTSREPMGNPCPACLLEEASQVGKRDSALTRIRHSTLWQHPTALWGCRTSPTRRRPALFDHAISGHHRASAPPHGRDPSRPPPLGPFRPPHPSKHPPSGPPARFGSVATPRCSVVLAHQRSKTPEGRPLRTVWRPWEARGRLLIASPAFCSVLPHVTQKPHHRHDAQRP
jgi:hypothetical protein